jgi:hypothetical protein
MQARKGEDLILLNDMINALNQYIAAKGTESKITSNRKGRRDDVKAIARHIFACAGMQSPLDEVEGGTNILPFIQSRSVLSDSTAGPWVYYRMVIGVRSVFDKLQTTIGFSKLRKKILPFIEKMEERLAERDIACQGMVVDANPFLSGYDPRYRVNTSSHTYQSTKMKFAGKDEKVRFEISASTWALMNKGKNPWGYAETSQEYIARKERQFAKIIEIITSGKKDIMFLQEVDCFTTPIFLTDPADFRVCYALQVSFLNYLKKLGWALISNGSISQGQLFITLYNINTLTPTGKVRMVLDGVGFESEFTHYSSGEKITFVNLHLNPTVDYRASLPAYQNAQIRANRVTILGGALEHTQKHIPGLINQETNCTSLVSRDKIYLQKCTDGFLLNTNQKFQAAIEEQPAEVFFRDEKTNGLVLRPLTPLEDYQDVSRHDCPPKSAWLPGSWRKFIAEGGWPTYLERQESAPKGIGLSIFSRKPVAKEQELLQRDVVQDGLHL